MPDKNHGKKNAVFLIFLTMAVLAAMFTGCVAQGKGAGEYIRSGGIKNVAGRTSGGTSPYIELGIKDHDWSNVTPNPVIGITDGTFRYIELADGTLGVMRYLGPGPTVTIPSEYDGKAITAVGVSSSGDIASDYRDSIFLYSEDTENIKEINLPDSIQSIGPGAFAGCRGVESITIPRSVTSIIENPFSGCIALAEINVE